MNPNPGLKHRAERSRSVYLRGLIGVKSGADAPPPQTAPTPLPTVAPTPPSQAALGPQYDLRTFSPKDLEDPEEWNERPQTVNLESNQHNLAALKAFFDELGAPVLSVTVGAAARVSLRLVGDSRVVLLCLCTAVLLAAVICVVVVPYKKRLPLNILVTLVGLWMGGFF